MNNLWNSPGILNFFGIATAYGACILLGCKVRETRNTIQLSVKHNKPLQYKQEVQMLLHGIQCRVSHWTKNVGEGLHDGVQLHPQRYPGNFFGSVLFVGVT